MLLITALRTYHYEDDPDGPPPRWMALLDSLTPLKTFVIGAVMVLLGFKLWIFTLSAIGVIREAELNRSQNILTYLVYVVGAELFFLLPVIIYAVAPQQSAATLKTSTAWLERHNRPITIAVSLFFGAIFFWKGSTGLLA
jgi:hypothetical protein